MGKNNLCNNCLLWQNTLKWIGTPFKFRDCVCKRGADCVSTPLSIWRDVGIISSEKFRELYSAKMFRLFRTNQADFLSFLCEVLGPDFSFRSPLKCGDLLIQVIGKRHEMFTSLFINKRYITARPVIGVQWLNSFDYSYKITFKRLTCPYEAV